MRTSNIVALPLVGLFAIGCVSLGEHEKLQKTLTQTQRDLNGVRGQLNDSQSQAKAIDSQLADAEARVKGLKAEAKSLQGELDAQKREREVLKEMIVELERNVAGQLKDKKQLKASVEEMRIALDELKRRKRQADERIAQFKSLIAKFKRLIDAGKLRVKIVDGRMVVELATDVLFGSGSARLSKGGKEAVSEVTAVLKDIAGRRFQIEGHTDNVPIKTSQYPSNWHLAAARAVTVVSEMVADGMEGERVSAASFGEHRPVSVNRTKEGRANNRRIEIVVVPDLSSLPGFEELRAAGS